MGYTAQMFLLYFSMALVIISSTVYHIIQKLTPANANPAITLFVTYASSAVLCLFLLPLYPLKDGLGPALKQLNWTSVALAIGVVGLELGFLLAYRAGWNISLAALIANIAAALLLIVVGTIFFKEKVSVVNIVGVVVCVVGLIMVNFKS